MDELFEKKRQLNTLNLEAAFKRRSSVTGFVHFDEKKPFDFQTPYIPFLENLSFALACFNQKTHEGFEEAKRLLTHLLAYETLGCFPAYLHQFPEIQDPYLGLKAYPYLVKIERYWLDYLPQPLKGMLKQVMTRVLEVGMNLELYPSMKILVQAIQHRTIDFIDLSREAAWAISLVSGGEIPLAFWDIRLGVLELSHQIWERGHPALNLFQFIEAQQKGSFFRELLQDHPLHLLLSIFYDPFESHRPLLVLNQVSPHFPGLIWRDDKQELCVISVDRKEGFEVSAQGERLYIKGDLALHEAFHVYFPSQCTFTQAGVKGTYFLKSRPIEVLGRGARFNIESSKNTSLTFQVRPGELFGELCCSLGIKSSGPFSLNIQKF